MYERNRQISGAVLCSHQTFCLICRTIWKICAFVVRTKNRKSSFIAIQMLEYRRQNFHIWALSTNTWMCIKWLNKFNVYLSMGGWVGFPSTALHRARCLMVNACVHLLSHFAEDELDLNFSDVKSVGNAVAHLCHGTCFNLLHPLRWNSKTFHRIKRKFDVDCFDWNAIVFSRTALKWRYHSTCRQVRA